MGLDISKITCRHTAQILAAPEETLYLSPINLNEVQKSTEVETKHS